MSAGTSDSRSSTYSFLNILLKDVGRQSATVGGRIDGPDKASPALWWGISTQISGVG
jgi:hypothetical protein